MKNKKIVVIGGGFASLSAACYLSQRGFSVTLIEKNKTLGGRAQQLHKEGFVFDMGPSFYWMPDVFERFFLDFGKKPSDYYVLEKLNPAYQVYFAQNTSLKIGDSLEEIKRTFDVLEPNSSIALQRFLDNAKVNYDIAIKDLIYKPGEHLREIMTPQVAMRLGLFFKSIRKQVAQHVKHPFLRKIMEFPVLFLGAKPEDTPAFYNFMNYADFVLGTWYPKGGMYNVVEGIVALCKSLGVEIHTDTEVTSLEINQNSVERVLTSQGEFPCDILLSGADYHHTEQLVEKKQLRQYSERYWKSRTFAPSALIFYVGFDKKIERVSHHTLFFDTDFEAHSLEIYDTHQWPQEPLFYASFGSMSDPNLAPEGKEAATFLIPISIGLEDTEEIRDHYFDKIINRLEHLTGQELKRYVLFKESMCVNDFVSLYNSYGGNAYGLANTLFQTHILRPRLRSKYLKNMYFAGHLTLPGPGVPPSLVSGKIASQLIIKNHEKAF